MKKRMLWISVIACMFIGVVSAAASTGFEMHEFFNSKGEKVIYPLAKTNLNSDMDNDGPQDQVTVGQIIQTKDGLEKVIAVDGQGNYVTEILDD